MKAKCVICGPVFGGFCIHANADTSVVARPITPVKPEVELQKEIDRLVNGVDPEFDQLKKIKEQSRIMYEALDKINNLTFFHLHEGPHIAADALDIVHPI